MKNTVEHNGQLSWICRTGLLLATTVFGCNHAGNLGKTVASFVRKLHVDLESAGFIHGRNRTGHNLTGSFGNPFHIVRNILYFTGLVVFTLHEKFLKSCRWNVSAGHRFGRCGRCAVAVNQTELQTGRFLNRINHLGIFTHAQSGNLNLDAAVSNCADDRLTHSESIDPLFHDVNCLGKLLLKLIALPSFNCRLVHLKRKGYPTLQVQTLLDFAAARCQQMF
ncbi:MAG: hypothetical protein BWY82_00974 [Verrucomicrobia bacterium ADurb.Bin474]|nr:MAG: hypothetical protein BWY82_00974 [Verrucomicrobia bacterium ADurb.Bin474]